ncbi:ATP-dependent 6-phosphofructokinase [Arthrobacter sp. I2-34]|uniref:ATP-dependent 6-phosphofructokinase n=1 Tax=Arthrobacter hankyongi TaxID=2904801 RepID=A0ABS9LCV7_9MICC|nr:ATP-dependent 6-phosphofructokinase [Arthrobacter hankyongi]MCG2624363.1 ATP-dependent 6-phosphofructokinase [Arthrobacter hankyongi]
MKIGILTSGGDCPGLNAVIRGAVLKGIKSHGHEFVGFRDGWRGLVEGDVMDLPRHSVRGISKQGGTILGTSRTNPFGPDGGPEVVRGHLERLGVGAVIAIGGEGTLAAAQRLTGAGLNIIGVPKTVDNDLDATDYTFGFDTAVQIATEAIDRLRTTGESHHRCMIAEVMGRNTGWIALHAGMASGAHAILIPEQQVSMDQVTEWVTDAHKRGRAPLVVVAEGFVPEGADTAHSHRGLDAFGRPRLGGIADRLAPEIEARTGLETRATVLGHIQRGGVPTAYDRVLSTRLGMAAADAAAAGAWGTMVALRGTDIVRTGFADALGKLKTVPEARYEEAAVLFG